MRFLFYSHDGVGLGHVRRHLAISAALAEAAPNSQVLLATSVDEVSNLGLPPNVDTLKLPGLRKIANNHYAARRLSLPTSEIRELRANILLAAVKSFRPAVVIVDKHPMGAGGEFYAALQAAKAAGARTVLGLRDILDEAVSVVNDWASQGLYERVAAYYDLVLVYGQREIFDIAEQYQFPAALSQRMQYCGYVVGQAVCRCHPNPCPFIMTETQGKPIVLATTGGGEDGFALLRTFIGAAANAEWQAIVVAGPMARSKDLATLQDLARDANVQMHSFLPCLSRALGQVDSVVSMGGYNTLVEAVSQGVPTLCVPRAIPRSEQLLRAEAFQKLGLIRMLHPREITLEKLRQEITMALCVPREELRTRAHETLSFDGAQRAAEHLLDLVSSVRRTKEGKLVPSC